MKFTTKVAVFALALSLTLPSAAVDSLFSQMEMVESKANSYEASGKYALSYNRLCEYADIADALANEEIVSRKTVDMAEAHRDYLEFAPSVSVAEESRRNIFVGSDGYFADGATAVRLSVPYGKANVEDYYHMIPKTTDELCVLVTFEVTREKTMRNIAFGNDDSHLIENLRQVSLIEGRVYLAFCPSVNTMRRTQTLARSYIAAYRYVAEAARRYAPNAELVYSLGDILIPGEDTVGMFYPGDEYVDVFGVELCNTYGDYDYPSSEGAFDRRGEYYDPVYSVKYMAEKFDEVCGKDGIPVAVTSCSFPWGGWAKLTDWADEMRRFYSLLPLACPELTAVFYTNISSAYGFCNLRQNKEAAKLYEECLKMPWYNGNELTVFDDGAIVKSGEALMIGVYAGMYGDVEYEVWLNGQAVLTDSAVLGEGVLDVYITDERCSAKLEYKLTSDRNGMLMIEHVSPRVDYNGNGIVDFGDTELLAAYISKWDVDLGNAETDLNGDGVTNSRDMMTLMTMYTP